MTIEQHTNPEVSEAAAARIGGINLVTTYALLALIATVANIAAQDVAVRIYRGAFAITVSVIVGTGVGLIIKYLLDKRFIFRFKARNAVHDSYTFMLYIAMGLVTTVIFWGFEFGFEYLFHSRVLRYVGAVLGLAIGYVAKYQLDKRFVFRTDAS